MIYVVIASQVVEESKATATIKQSRVELLTLPIRTHSHNLSLSLSLSPPPLFRKNEIIDYFYEMSRIRYESE